MLLCENIGLVAAAAVGAMPGGRLATRGAVRGAGVGAAPGASSLAVRGAGVGGAPMKGVGRGGGPACGAAVRAAAPPLLPFGA